MSLFKQWGTWAPDPQASDPYPSPTLPGLGGLPGWPPMKRMSKKTAGRLLDGRTWDDYPTGGTR
jgi:hypothetical protein